MRLIDADGLLLIFAEYQLQESPNWGANGYGSVETYKAITECMKAVEEQPTIEPERLKDKLDDAYAHGYTAAEAKYRKWIEKLDRIIRELGVNCAYDMPSFWCNQGKDYKVIPTKYHKGYMQALADVEERMKGAEE